MAYILRKIGNADNIAINYYEVDTERDMQEIDVANAPMGSRCYVINTGSTYTLNSSKEWKLVPTSGGETPSGGTEQFIVTVTDYQSDKTPAEIAEAAKAGKQVVLKNDITDDGQFCYLVNADNNLATFCGTIQMTEGTDDVAPKLGQSWLFIFNNKTVTYSVDFNIIFYIEKYSSGKYMSNISPTIFVTAVDLGCTMNAILNINGEGFLGTIKYLKGEGTIHIYFPDYAKDKVYDLKWNGDNPATYTFTELSLGGSGNSDSVVIKSSTPNSSKKFRITVDDAGTISATEIQ